MRDEWKTAITAAQPAPPVGTVARDGTLNAAAAAAVTRSSSGFTADSRSSQGLTRVGNELDRSASLNLAARAMKLKMKTKGLDGSLKKREVSERRQVGDAESVVNPLTSSTTDGSTGGEAPWWKNVTMEEGM